MYTYTSVAYVAIRRHLLFRFFLRAAQEEAQNGSVTPSGLLQGLQMGLGTPSGLLQVLQKDLGAPSGLLQGLQKCLGAAEGQGKGHRNS